MRLVALLGTWLGLIIMAIAVWLLPFADRLGQGSTFVAFIEHAGQFGLSTLARWFCDWGYMITFVMVFGLGPFTAVGTRIRWRIVGAIGYGLLAFVVIAALVSAWSVLNVAGNPWDRFMVGLLGVMAVLSVAAAVCSLVGTAHLVALPAMLFTMVGLVCSQKLVLDLGADPDIVVQPTAYALPIGYLVTMLALLGSFLSGTRLGPDSRRPQPPR